MTQMLIDFIKALRSADVRVSTAESLDGAATLSAIGLENKQLLKHALSQTLAKTIEDKIIFDKCFDTYFGSLRSDHETDNLQLEPNSNSVDPGAQSGGNAGNEGDGEGEGSSTSQGNGTNSLVDLLERNDRAALQQQMASAARNIQLQNIRLFTQRGMYVRRIAEVMGIEEVDDTIFGLMKKHEDNERALLLKNSKSRLLEDIGELVDKELLLYTANAGKHLREEVLHKTPLARIEMRDFKVMHELVRKLAKKLVSLHARRRHVSRRGQLDVRRTIRNNLEYDGLLFKTVWKKVRVDRPKVIAVCDVSGSVAQVARFMLLFLYSMSEVIPKVRAFAFSNYLGEVTHLFEELPVEDALTETINKWGMGSTDYGGAISELERLVVDDLDQKTTVLILGDARSNYGDPGERALRRIQERARRVLWLNPEPRSFWDTGDSEMQKLGTACHRVEPCRTLKHLERVVSEIARTAI